MFDLCGAYYTLMVTISQSNAEAAQYVEKSLVIGPKNTDPLVSYAVRFFDANKAEDALCEFKRVLEINQEHVFAK